MSFFRLDKPVQFLKGVGPVRAEALGRMGIVTARDLLYHVPRRYDDASTIQSIAEVEIGTDATVVGRVRSTGVIPTRKGLRIFQAVLKDHSGMITCAWPGQPWLERKLQKGDLLLATGPVKFFHGRQLRPREFSILGRNLDDTTGEESEIGHIFATYPASEEVPQWVLRGLFKKNLDLLLSNVIEEEYLSADEQRVYSLPSLPESLGVLHRPTSLEGVEEARRRLAYDELFFLQLVQARARYRETIQKQGIVFGRTDELIRPLHEALPFRLTTAQARVLREIYSDMGSSRRMNRLLQGDVGSGKTVVALFSMLLAVEAGYQAVLMAPTELLAEQHARSMRKLMEPLGIEVYVLTGQLAAPDRRETLSALREGTATLVVGTQALIQKNVEFRKLGMVVVDEQHRFGVRQRMVFGDRENPPDILIMSATPIPRSLAMALYGDLDLSVLDEMPKGRKPIRTFLRYPNERKDVYQFVEEELKKGHQAYVVYPLVAESDKMDMRSATEGYERLTEATFGHRRVGLLHGQLSSEIKDQVMRGFLAGEIDVLVATTVIEVGIDVPNASVMVIEHAERFGLSQLHQLRGRVGRGATESHCILIADPGEVAAERLKIFCNTSDGFAVARADLRLRGQGDLFGAQQHGRDPVLRFADLSMDEELLMEAHNRARSVVNVDPDLQGEDMSLIKKLMDHRYAEKLKLFSVG
ncbi:MAG: ATP-dependent DNA helicase RecG [Gemmatimonadota bacterium]|nr:ATP-dependent DNA helicase RecG [Gemmatimonadota bacterium]